MQKVPLSGAPKGAYIAAGAQLMAIAIGALSFAGPPPVEGKAVVTLSMSVAYWIVAMWIVSILGMVQAFVSLSRKRQQADEERDRALAARDEANAALALKRDNQVLSDLMSEQWEFAVHELLNKKLTDDQSFREWRDSVKRWAAKTVEIMKEHGCTKQDIRSVKVIGLAPLIPTLHPNPVIAHAMSMVAAQIDRVADIARKYGD